MKNNTVSILSRVVLLAIIFFNLSTTLFSHATTYTLRNYWQNFPALKAVYNNSQYVNKHPKGWIPDEAVNSYAGGAYILGVGPHLIAPDTPPLGRYLIGISAMVFNNPNEVILLSALLSILFMYLLGLQIFKNKTIALIPAALITFEPIFLNQLIYTPLLDIIQLVFLLSSFYFFNLWMGKKNTMHVVIAVLLTGCFMATKFFITGLTILAAMGFVLFVHRYWQKLLVYLLISPLSFLVVLASYIRVFAYKYTFLKFLGIQKWVFLYHKSQLILPFSIWPLLLFNKWYVWFGNSPVISDGQWRITWPILALLTGVTVVLYIAKKIPFSIEIEVLMTWVVCYILFFSFGEISSRYLVIYIPVLYIIGTYGVFHMGKVYLKRKIKK